MNIIFLDVDGVLNTIDTFKVRKEEYIKSGIILPRIDEYRLLYLKEIVESTNAKIVLSSTWRKDFIKVDDKLISNGKDAYELLYMLSKYNLEICDIINPKKSYKQDGIKEWLESHNVDNFIIIDDESYDLVNYSKYLIKTRNSNKEQTGLLKEHVVLAINMLCKKKLVLKNKHKNK